LALLKAKDEQVAELTRQVAALTDEVQQLVVRLNKDSKTGGKPPSSAPVTRRPKGGSSRTSTERKPGGAEGLHDEDAAAGRGPPDRQHRPDVRRSDLVVSVAGLSPFEQPLNDRTDVFRARDRKVPRSDLSTVHVSDLQLHVARPPQCKSPSPRTFEEVKPHDGITARTIWVLSRLALDPPSPEHSLMLGDPLSERRREVPICHLISNRSMFKAGGNCGTGRPSFASRCDIQKFGPRICAHPGSPPGLSEDRGTSNST